MRIVIDTREQRPLAPWRAPKKGDDAQLIVVGPDRRPRFIFPTFRAKLDAGDYSIEGLETVIFVERKAIPDLYGSLFGGGVLVNGERRGNAERLEEEFARASAPTYQRRLVLIEGTQEDLEAHMFTRGSKVAPRAAFSMCARLAGRYDLSWVWLPNSTADRSNVNFFLGCYFDECFKLFGPKKDNSHG